MPTLHFKGKSIIRAHHLTLPYRQLTPDPARSLTEQPGLHDNLIIHGDNLLALKSLLPSFSGKIKCITIDPPYNTGNEKWVYNDAVNSPMHQDWLFYGVIKAIHPRLRVVALYLSLFLQICFFL